ncbi:hypothetical protein H5V45_10205 [Nocardioides sp. KIGAM211]|uniref:Uncharacterized protein n=1 Tax=Nocardioides luti TaxID=2761101 RepID=A0A7X0RGB0_9ACTN|nr:hypothetical protein [Nocardioides luti]MBB6627692.1 hypothetical protein [Nocardioides luti]
MTRVSIRLDGTPAPSPGLLARVPRRVRLSRQAVEALADRTGTPLPWSASATAEPSRTERSLGPQVPTPRGGDAATSDPDPQPDAATSDPDPQPGDGTDPEAELREARLLTADGQPHPEVAGALAVFGAPEALVDVDLSVRRNQAASGFAQVRSWQRLRAGRVTTMATAGGAVELGWFDDDLWQVDLARTVTVTRPRTTARAPEQVLDLPHELLLGSGEALRLHRGDVLAELVARHAGSVFADDGDLPLGLAGTDEQVRLLNTSALGRLRTVVSGLGPTGARKVGWVSWLLFPDGWRALTPYSSGGVARVRIHPVEPLRLGVDVAALVTGVRA